MSKVHNLRDVDISTETEASSTKDQRISPASL